VRAAAPREPGEREMGVLAGTVPISLSSDGRQLLLMDFGLAGRSFLRPTLGGPPLLLARGRPLALSADASSVLVDPGWPGPPKLLLTPTGAGESRSLSTEGLETIESAWLAPPGRAVLNASARGGRRRAFVVDAAGGKPVPVTPEGVLAVGDSFAGGTLIGWAGDGTLARYGVSGGDPVAIGARLPKHTHPLRLSEDGRALFVAEPGVPARIDRLDLASGERKAFKVLQPEDAAGVYLVDGFLVTATGEAYAYSYQRFLQDLYLVAGIR